METGDSDDYLQLPPPVDEDDEYWPYPLRPEQEEEEDDDGRETVTDIIPRLDFTGRQGDSKLAAAVVQALETVEAPSDGRDCPICLQDGGVTAAWKETACGHRLHGRCMETWLRSKGSCPMCRGQVVTMPAAAATRTTAFYQHPVSYGRISSRRMVRMVSTPLSRREN